MQRSFLVLGGWLVLVTFATAYMVGPSLSTAEEPENVTVVMPYWPTYMVHTWAAFDGAVDDTGFTIKNESADDIPYAGDAAVTGYADIALVPLTDVPAIHRRDPDIRVLPYQLELPSDWVGVYTRPDNGIVTTDDLEGKDIVRPTRFCRLIGILHFKTFTELERRGVDTTTINWTRVPPTLPGPTFGGNTSKMLDTYDAALVSGYPEGRVEPAFYPFENASIVSMVFVAQPDAVDHGEAWFRLLNRSARYGQAHMGGVMQSLQGIAPGNRPVAGNGLLERLSTRDVLVSRFDTADRRHIQAVFDRMHRVGRTQHRLNLSSVLAAPADQPK